MVGWRFAVRVSRAPLLCQLPRQETSWPPSFPIREMVQTVETVTANTQVFTGEGLTF